jgi:hypothetical protein
MYPMSLVGFLWGVQANPELCNSNSILLLGTTCVFPCPRVDPAVPFDPATLFWVETYFWLNRSGNSTPVDPAVRPNPESHFWVEMY